MHLERCFVEAVKAYYDGQVFVPMFPVNVAKDRLAIVTILDSMEWNVSQNNCLQYAGQLKDNAYQELTEILQETEKVDKNGW
jgi:hypothetical protein